MNFQPYPEHGFLFWKVTVNGRGRILGLHVNGGRLDIIPLPVGDFMNFKTLCLGSGSDIQIIGCNFYLPSDVSPVLNIWTMNRHVDQKWRWHFVSDILMPVSPDTTRFVPLVNFSIGDEEYYFFLRNEDTIVRVRSADRKLWQSKVIFSKFDGTPIDLSPLGFRFIQGSSMGFESLQFTAVGVGPRTYKPEEDYTNNDEGPTKLTKQQRGVGKPFRE